MKSLLGRVPAPLQAAAIYAVGLAWTKGLALLLVPILTRALPPDMFGRLEVLSSLAEIGALIAGAGLVDTLYRFAGNGDRRAAGRVAGLAIAISTLACLAVAVFADRLATIVPGATATDVRLIGLAVALEPAIGVPLAWLRLAGQPGRYTAATVLRATFQSVLVAALVWRGFGIEGVLVAGLAAALAMALSLNAFQAAGTGVAFSPRDSLGFLRYGVPLIGAGLAAFVLGTADRMLLAGHVPSSALGEYGLAAKFSMMAALLTQPFELWWYPRRLGLLAEPDGLDRSARIVGTGAALVLLSAGGAAVAGPFLIATLTPVAYHGAIALVPWLCAALALQSLGSLASVGCYAGRSGSPSLMVNGGAAVVALAGYLLLIPGYGVPGAVAATVAAQAARLALFHALSQRRVCLSYPLGAIGMVAALSAAAAALAVALPPGLPALAGGGACLLLAAGAGVALGLLPVRMPGRALTARAVPAGTGAF